LVLTIFNGTKRQTLGFKAYANVSNYAVGVFMASAGYGQDPTVYIAQTYGMSWWISGGESKFATNKAPRLTYIFCRDESAGLR
jgi:hypothetical protein